MQTKVENIKIQVFPKVFLSQHYRWILSLNNVRLISEREENKKQPRTVENNREEAELLRYRNQPKIIRSETENNKRD